MSVHVSLEFSKSSGLALRLSYVSTRSLRYEPAKQLIIAWLNGHFMGLISLIHEVLNREKLMGLMPNVEGFMLNKKSMFGFVQERPIKKIQAIVIFNHAKGRNQSKSSATKTFNIRSIVLVFGLWSSQYS
ncbi:hypothetical protein YC2023_082325 [Brassica napus]